ncbi:hypothetical protein SKAU_G00375600 [Synaphobranchus kaupii]|uniref:Uncharacterized protein n=1 Tax=Synaphobranchus kaupii TaxID=118154 RepID=A0A9Q1IGE6_SYNKA|nr:hypothetical protein SKAU_G00375600 [Synaphobranchus kaupii]
MEHKMERWAWPSSPQISFPGLSVAKNVLRLQSTCPVPSDPGVRPDRDAAGMVCDALTLLARWSRRESLPGERWGSHP